MCVVRTSTNPVSSAAGVATALLCAVALASSGCGQPRAVEHGSPDDTPFAGIPFRVGDPSIEDDISESTDHTDWRVLHPLEGHSLQDVVVQVRFDSKQAVVVVALLSTNKHLIGVRTKHVGELDVAIAIPDEEERAYLGVWCVKGETAYGFQATLPDDGP